MIYEKNVVELDEERKAAMISNLLVVLCSEEGAQPELAIHLSPIEPH